MSRVLVIGLAATVVVLVGLSCGSLSSNNDDATSGGAAREWVEVITLSGADLAISPPFELHGGEQKLEYTIEGGDMLIAGFHVEPAGMDAAQEGALPDVACQEAGQGERPLRTSAGTYQLVGEAGGCTWTCTLSELR